ncbi:MULTISPECIES: thiolase C-terminal domain-containing protein [unclassified Mycobacterium]|uniref:thiolase C-terminal domain-containing protein n=1 Tax=unclassified Mycobacterium TaxID=2642494 RepID=UPI0029C6B89D|nr:MULTISPECIES: lipid-transfer protein [unclassified Mycobacterium]
MNQPVFVIGVGMTKFEKPLRRAWTYPEMVAEAVNAALDDAGVHYDEIGIAFGGTSLGALAQRSLYTVGTTGVPIMTVTNACASGSSALYLARQAVKAGAPVALAVGWEKMKPGSLGTGVEEDGPGFLDLHLDTMADATGAPLDAHAPPTVQMFGNAGREHMARYGSTPEHFAWIGWKNHKHSVNNPRSQFQDEYTLEQIAQARMIWNPLTKLQCSPTSDGAASAIVASERFVEEHDLWDQAIELAGHHIATDAADSFSHKSSIDVVGAQVSRRAAAVALEQAQVSIGDVDVIELHDCFSTNELLTYEALGMAPEGEGHKLVETSDTTYGGRWVVNPSGGLISKGHPIGATGVAQCAELTWQLRGHAGDRQVPNARIGLQHNIGLGSACAVAIYRRPR